MPQKIESNFKELAKTVGSRIEKERKSLKIFQSVLAVDVGISRTQLSYIERGMALPKLDVLYCLCGRLGLTVYEVLPQQEEVVTMQKRKEDILDWTDEGLNQLRSKVR